jgi:hypothetical protein
MAKYIVKRTLFSKNRDLEAAAALTAGGIVANDAGVRILKKQGRGVKEESKEISKKLAEEAERQGTKVYKTSVERSHYANPKVVKLIRGKGIKIAGGKAGDYIASDPNRADVLAHELGHSKHSAGRSGSIIGKAAHKAYSPSKAFLHSPAGLAASYINGYKSGVNSARAEREGKKESVANKVRTPALSVGVASPVLVSEFEASRQGLKAMRRAGASSKLIKDAKLRLAAAGGTYATVAGINAGAGYLGRHQGKKSVKKNKK